MQKDDTVYLGHMLDMARKVSDRVTARSKTDFDTDEDLCFVIAYSIQTIGETAAQGFYPHPRGACRHPVEADNRYSSPHRPRLHGSGL